MIIGNILAKSKKDFTQKTLSGIYKYACENDEVEVRFEQKRKWKYLRFRFNGRFWLLKEQKEMEYARHIKR